MTIDLDELERLCAEATGGPWIIKSSAGILSIRASEYSPAIAPRIQGASDWRKRANAAFIAAARTAVPELIEEVKKLRMALTKQESQNG